MLKLMIAASRKQAPDKNGEEIRSTTLFFLLKRKSVIFPKMRFLLLYLYYDNKRRISIRSNRSPTQNQ